jgi:hypothetical protein
MSSIAEFLPPIQTALAGPTVRRDFGLATVIADPLSGTLVCRFPGILAVAGHTPSGAWTALPNADIPLIGGLTIALNVFRREIEASLLLKSEDNAGNEGW